MLKRTAAAGAALAWVVPAVEAVGVPKAFAGGTGGTCGSGAPKPWTSLSYVACALRATTGCEPLGVNEGDCFGFKFDFSDDCNDDKPHCDVVTQPKQTPCGDQDALLCSSYHTDSSGEQYYDGFQSGFPPGCGFLTGNGITTNSNLVCNTDGSISFTFPFGSDAPSYEVVGWI
ncbi:MAG: hypothetical protein ACRDYD_01235, partial [Acidimicrobiales bacterium]